MEEKKIASWVEPGDCVNDANKGLCEGHFGQSNLMFGTWKLKP